MKTKKVITGMTSASAKSQEETKAKEIAHKIEKKKKHSSALAAAAQAKSAISQVGAHAYRDIAHSQTGTNLSYKEEDGIL